MEIRWNFTNDKPIYLQMIEMVKRLIVSGEIKPGDRLDSVRDIAASAKVNPNTVQRALAELERTGLVYTQRTNGRFITDDENLIESIKTELAQNEIIEFLGKMEQLGFDKHQICEMIKRENEHE